jgi:hypothetical protein
MGDHPSLEDSMPRHDRSILRVMNKPCDECLYSNKKIVSDKRRDQLVALCAAEGTHFVCHKASDAGEDVMCRGHWDRTKNDTLRNRLAQALGVVVLVSIEQLERLQRYRQVP